MTCCESNMCNCIDFKWVVYVQLNQLILGTVCAIELTCLVSNMCS